MINYSVLSQPNSLSSVLLIVSDPILYSQLGILVLFPISVTCHSWHLTPSSKVGFHRIAYPRLYAIFFLQQSVSTVCFIVLGSPASIQVATQSIRRIIYIRIGLNPGPQHLSHSSVNKKFTRNCSNLFSRETYFRPFFASSYAPLCNFKSHPINLF